MPPQVRENSMYLLRNSSNTSTIHANSNLYYNSFLLSVIRLWNNLPLLVRNITSLSDFKKNMTGQERKAPVCFILGAGQLKYSTRDYDLSVALLILIYLKKKKTFLIALDVLVGKSRRLNIIYPIVYIPLNYVTKPCLIFSIFP